MIIIIEGPDGGGKTTLANKIHQQSNYPIIHRSKPENQDEKDMMAEMYIETIKRYKNAIFDRCWYSELAYGPVMRDTSVISIHQMYAFEKRLTKVGALLIYCTGSKRELWARCKRRGEDYIVDKDKFNQIYDKFEEIMSMPHFIPVLKCEIKGM